MRIILVMLVFISFISASAQSKTWYVAAKSGLSIREKADAAAKVLDKIPYGTKITLVEVDENVMPVSTEGFNGFWRKVNYNNKSGYVVTSYLFPSPPPKPTIKTIRQYLSQLSATFGNVLTVKRGEGEADDVSWSTTKKQLYKNGAEWHEWQGYESASETYFIPGFTIEQGFLLIKILKVYPKLIGEGDAFPVKNTTAQKDQWQKKVFVEKEDLGHGNFWLKKIRIEYEEGALYNFELFEIDNQLVIVYNSGV